jgi:hypothetical protein
MYAGDIIIQTISYCAEIAATASHGVFPVLLWRDSEFSTAKNEGLSLMCINRLRK